MSCCTYHDHDDSTIVVDIFNNFDRQLMLIIFLIIAGTALITIGITCMVLHK